VRAEPVSVTVTRPRSAISRHRRQGPGALGALRAHDLAALRATRIANESGTQGATPQSMRSSRIVLALWVAFTASCAISDDHGLGAARARWADQHLTSYQITSQTGCFCPPERTDPIRLVVTGGAIASASYVADQRALGAAILQDQLTVEGAFARIQDALDRHASDLQVTFDPLRGYPRSIRIDYAKNIGDDEWSLTLSDLAP
jgi:hypothetical protein